MKVRGASGELGESVAGEHSVMGGRNKRAERGKRWAKENE